MTARLVLELVAQILASLRRDEIRHTHDTYTVRHGAGPLTYRP